MRQFTKMHFIENAVWVSLVILLFAFSFEFDKEIEIYKFGAAGWASSSPWNAAAGLSWKYFSPDASR